MKYIEVILSEQEAKKIIQNKGWIKVGENTSGDTLWNENTGELLECNAPFIFQKLNKES